VLIPVKSNFTADGAVGGEVSKSPVAKLRVGITMLGYVY